MEIERKIENIQENCFHYTAKFDKRTALMQKDIKNISDKQDIVLKKFIEFEKKFVTKTEFWPVKTIVYGLVSTILLSVLVGLIALVVRN